MGRAMLLALAGVGLGACAEGSGSAKQDAAPRIDATIDSNGCAVQPCSILPQCGCNGNTACDIDLVDVNGTACRPINAMGTETATCNMAEECDRNYTCVGGVSFRSCKKYCTADADCIAPRGKCFYTLTDGSGDPIPNVPKTCSSNCDPTDTTAALCPSTMKCTMARFSNGDVVDCTPAGTMMQGADCKGPNGAIESRCARGYQCTTLDSGTTFACRKICTAPGTTTGCGANNCVGFAPQPLTVGGTTYGVCGP